MLTPNYQPYEKLWTMLSAIYYRMVWIWCGTVYASGGLFLDFSCVAHNWNDYMTCRWTLAPRYTVGYTTAVTWGILPGQTHSPCPILTSDTCTWNLGGDGGHYDVSPDIPLDICLQLHVVSGGQVVGRQCQKIYTHKIVKPSPVTSLHAVPLTSSCLRIEWSHSKDTESKLYTLRLSSNRGNATKVITPQVITSDYQTDEEVDVCSLSPYTAYTVTVTVRPLDMDGAPTGFPSDPATTRSTTQKTVPSRPPYLPKGGFTRSVVNAAGYRTATVYWTALPEHFWNGDTVTYKVEVRAGCGLSSTLVHRTEIYVSLDVLHNCSYTVTVWSVNEIGQSADPSQLYIPSQVFDKPTDVFLNATQISENGEISWNTPPDAGQFPVVSYTLYWCLDTPTKSCMGNLNNKTVASNELRTVITMKGFPTESYIFGVSAERLIHETIISSGFEWIDCSGIFKRTLHSPRMAFHSFPSERRMLVSWVYPYCDSMVMRSNYRRMEYHVTICPTRNCDYSYSKILPETQNFLNIFDISPGTEVCIFISVKLDDDNGRSSQVKCHTQGQELTGYSVKTPLIVSLSILGVAILIVLVFTRRKICKWWKTKDEIILPDMALCPGQLLNMTTLSSTTEESTEQPVTPLIPRHSM